MDYKKFEDNVRMDLPKSLLGTFPHISVEPAEVTKLQGMSYSGISVRQEGSQMPMTINLDSFYRDYESGAVYEDVLQGITDYVVTHISQTPEFDLDMLKNSQKFPMRLLRIWQLSIGFGWEICRMVGLLF